MQTFEEVFVIFDGPPAHVSGRFVEVETAAGKSVGSNVGLDWEQYSPSYLWRLGPFSVPTSDEVEAADVLDRMANPHPRMWREATAAFAARDTEPEFWRGFLAAMCAATGYEPEYFIAKLEEA